MHELAITQSIVSAVRQRLDDAPIRSVTLEVGELSGVVVDSVRFCFDLCTTDTPLAGAQLDVLCTQGHGHCRSCGRELPMPDFLTLCTCGSADLDVLGGQELRIKQVELA